MTMMPERLTMDEVKELVRKFLPGTDPEEIDTEMLSEINEAITDSEGKGQYAAFVFDTLEEEDVIPDPTEGMRKRFIADVFQDGMN